MDNHALLAILVALVGVSVFIQVIIMLGAAAAIVALRKAIISAVETTADLKATIVPMVHNSRQLVERISPQVISITADVAELTQILRKETVTVKDSLNEMVDRVNKQTARLDTMLTSSLNAVDRAGSVIESAVSVPVRQANGIFAAVKAVIETYRAVDPRKANASRNGDLKRPRPGNPSTAIPDRDFEI